MPQTVGSHLHQLDGDARRSTPEGAAQADADAQKVYQITQAGREELGWWLETLMSREVIPRRELAVKLVFAMRSGLADVAVVVQRQRVATVRVLRDVTWLRPSLCALAIAVTYLVGYLIGSRGG